jgi:hypothetical protein
MRSVPLLLRDHIGGIRQRQAAPIPLVSGGVLRQFRRRRSAP